jgi:hypothetical protein
MNYSLRGQLSGRYPFGVASAAIARKMPGLRQEEIAQALRHSHDGEWHHTFDGDCCNEDMFFDVDAALAWLIASRPGSPEQKDADIRALVSDRLLGEARFAIESWKREHTGWAKDDAMVKAQEQKCYALAEKQIAKYVGLATK